MTAQSVANRLASLLKDNELSGEEVVEFTPSVVFTRHHIGLVYEAEGKSFIVTIEEAK